MPNYTNFNNNLQSMVPSLIIKRVEMAIQTFLKHDSFLINNNIHEQAISHRLALYLDELFPNYHVDCEWNKVSNNPKIIEVNEIVESIKDLIDELRDNTAEYQNPSKIDLFDNFHHLLSNNNKTIKDIGGSEYLEIEEGERRLIKKIRPDIIIHTRSTKNNICVIEVKKENTTNTYQQEKFYDLIKLYALTTKEPYKYKIGIYIEFPSNINEIKGINIIKSKTLEGLFSGQNRVYEVDFS